MIKVINIFIGSDPSGKVDLKAWQHNNIPELKMMKRKIIFSSGIL